MESKVSGKIALRYTANDSLKQYKTNVLGLSEEIRQAVQYDTMGIQ